MTVAAMTGPTPKTSVSVVPDARTAAVSFFAGLAEQGVEAAQVREVPGGQVVPGLADRAGRLTSGEDGGRPVGGDVLTHAARGDLAQHGVQPAGGLGAQRGQLAVAAGPDPQHGRVVIGGHLMAGGRAQRGHGDRAGVILVVLVRRPARQQPDPGAELGLHVEDLLAGRDELLGQHVAQAARALDRPGPVRPAGGPFQQPDGLPGRGPYRQLAQRHLGRVDRYRRVRRLVRVHSDHHRCHQQPFRWLVQVTGSNKGMTEPRRACLISGRQAVGPFSSHATAGPGGWPLVIKPDPRKGRQSHREPATGIPGNYGKNPAVPTRHTIRADGAPRRPRSAGHGL